MSVALNTPRSSASRLGPGWKALREQDGLGPALQVVVFLLVLFALFTRKPDTFLHPQFYAEDGKVWFQQAYNLGWLKPLSIPWNGYIQTLPRLVVDLLLPLPLHLAPLGMNLAAAIVQSLPVTVLLSRRCRTWGPLPLRLLMALIYVAIPDASEIHVVLTNAMWHLVVLQLIIAFAEPPATNPGRVFDLVIAVLSAGTGPFCIFMVLPIAFYAWRRRSRWTAVLAAVAAAGALVQLICIHGAVRAAAEIPLGATASRLLRILAGDILLDSMVGVDFRRGGPNYALPLLAVVLLCGVAVIVWGCRRAPLALQLYAGFALLTLAASLKNPAILGPAPRWSLLISDQICRYWFYPSLLFLWSAAWCVWQKDVKIMRVAGVFVLGLLLVGTVRNWRYPAWPDNNFSVYARQFEQARPGETVAFPIYPSPDWTMKLTRR